MHARTPHTTDTLTFLNTHIHTHTRTPIHLVYSLAHVLITTCRQPPLPISVHTHKCGVTSNPTIALPHFADERYRHAVVHARQHPGAPEPAGEGQLFAARWYALNWHRPSAWHTDRLTPVSIAPTVVDQLKKASLQSEDRIKELESRLQSLAVGAPAAAAATALAAAAAPAAASKASDDDDGVDLFGSDSEEEDDEAAKLREKRLAEYANKKSKKPTLIAKSNIILDIKPWDDETDMKAMEAEVRKIVQDGLLWGAAKLVPIAYGILKLQISCVVEDDKVSLDALTEQLEAIEDFVQSVDIAAFNKI